MRQYSQGIWIAIKYTIQRIFLSDSGFKRKIFDKQIN